MPSRSQRRTKAGVPFARLVAALEAMAPLELAESWDNVGLLVQPSRTSSIRRALLSIDLTEEVLDEAIEENVGFIVAYHPPIFAPLSRLAPSDPRERVLIRCIENRICVYSPHTALDAAPAGVNDWLVDAFGKGTRRAVLRASDPQKAGPDSRVCSPAGNDPEAGTSGQGRLLLLDRALTVSGVVRRVKEHLGLRTVRLALSRRNQSTPKLRHVGVCAGSGGAILEECFKQGVTLDLFLTGELRHHDILAANARGVSVLLTDHTHTERGFLPVLAARIGKVFGSALDVIVSRRDTEPLKVH